MGASKNDLGKNKLDPIVEKLKAERLARGIKQVEMARLLDLNTDSSMSAYENGQVVPRITFIRDWAYALDFDLALVPIEKPTRGRRKAPDTQDVPEDLNSVHLTRYQTALAMGILIGQSGQLRTDSPGMSADLQVIADILARSIH